MHPTHSSSGDRHSRTGTAPIPLSSFPSLAPSLLYYDDVIAHHRTPLTSPGQSDSRTLVPISPRGRNNKFASANSVSHGARARRSNFFRYRCRLVPSASRPLLSKCLAVSGQLQRFRRLRDSAKKIKTIHCLSTRLDKNFANDLSFSIATISCVMRYDFYIMDMCIIQKSYALLGLIFSKF